MSALEEYFDKDISRHNIWCNIRDSATKKCSCGYDEATQEFEAFRAENAEMREALKPFADIAILFCYHGLEIYPDEPWKKAFEKILAVFAKYPVSSSKIGKK